MKTTLPNLLTLVLPFSLCAHAGNWPGWRGGDGTGVSSEKNLPVNWSTTDNVRWRIDLPDRGNLLADRLGRSRLRGAGDEQR